MLVSPKDRTPTAKESGVVYQIPCKQCDKSYIGQTGRQLGERVKEHRSLAPSRIPSAIAEHSVEYNHRIDWEGMRVLEKERRNFPRLVKEALQIRREGKATMNRDGGLDLPAIYNTLLQPCIQPQADASCHHASLSLKLKFSDEGP